MRRLVKLLNKKDIRYLLIDEVWPDDYFDYALITASEIVMKEYQELRGDGIYDKAIEEKGAELNKELRLYQLKGIRFLFEFNKLKAQEVLRICGLGYQTYEEIDKAIKQREFDEQVKNIREKSTPKKEVTFEEMCIPLIRHYKMAIDKNITVSMFVALENSMKKELQKTK